MKKLAVIIALIASVTYAAPNQTITNWISGYQYIASTNSDVGTTGISTGTAYVCFALTNLTFLSAADADEATGDVRELQFAIVKSWYDQYYAAASTNRPAQLTIGETSTYDASTNADLKLKYSIEAKVNLSGTGIAIPDE